MITEKEINEATLSTSKKDFYQIWNELLELAEKISTRWSPASTNESDPGIVLLKALTAIADKLNYNADKKALEAFMPSVTQEESMRHLTEMLGYTMHYYRSATTTATIKYTKKDIQTIGLIYFPKYVNLKNEDEDVNYVTLEDFTLNEYEQSRKVAIAEGEVILCESDNDNIISTLQLDDSNRYFLPETHIAENCIFITNIDDSVESAEWKKVDNLNTIIPSSEVFTFGYSSTQGLPYVQFPEDIATIMKDGLRIRYIRTNGNAGNIAAGTLSKLEVPSLWSTADSSEIKALDTDCFSITNTSATDNGADPESIDAAYINFKKTIGTFDTLVTCRDYMNKIYQLTESSYDTTPLVSNVLVADIRDDINKSITLCSFNEYGISYSNRSLKSNDGTTDLINHFDLVLYPFKTVYGLNTKSEFDNSFKLNHENNSKILYDLEDYKTISHNFTLPNTSDIACIRNLLQLTAKVTTNKKVTALEGNEILANIRKSIYKNFNMRCVDFGEALSEELLLKAMESADARIKEVTITNSNILTKITLADGTDTLNVNSYESCSELTRDDSIYNKLVLRNVLAGRVSAFKYDEAFTQNYDETAYGNNYAVQYPIDDTYQITRLKSAFEVKLDDMKKNKYGDSGRVELKENQVIQFRLPNFKTTVSYASYVNYYLHLTNQQGITAAVPATFTSATTFMSNYWAEFANSVYNKENTLVALSIIREQDFSTTTANYDAVFYKNDEDKYSTTTDWVPETTSYFGFKLKAQNFSALESWLRTKVINEVQLAGLYRLLRINLQASGGYLITSDGSTYTKVNEVTDGSVLELSNYYVQETHPNTEQDEQNYTSDGLGKDASFDAISKDMEYQLDTNEYLLINYTESETSTDGQTTINTKRNIEYGPGTIIKPNFAIISSDLYASSHSYAKKDDFLFPNYPSCPGLFTLGSDQKIDIREIVKVELSEISNLYWSRQDDQSAISEIESDQIKSEFTFDEYYGKKDTDYKEGVPNAYTLKENEYFFYTDKDMLDLVYYGAGTLIVKSPNFTSALTKTDEGVSADDIMSYGLSANIPWSTYALSETNKLTIIENQYITLTEGDKLLTIDLPDTNKLDSTWVDVKTATYLFTNDTDSQSLPVVAVGNLTWKVHSKLEFNITSTKKQTLHYGDTITLVCDNGSEVKLTVPAASNSDTTTPLIIGSNYSCQWSGNSLTLDLPAQVVKELGKFKIQTSKAAPPTIGNDETKTINLHNYINDGTYYTKVDIADLDGSTMFSLNVNIPNIQNSEGQEPFGLMMIYYTNNNISAGGSSVYPKISCVDSTDTAVNGITKFNTSDKEDLNSSLELSYGINIIKVTSQVAKLTLDFSADNGGKVIISDTSIVTSINPKLKYKYANTKSALEALLDDIRKLKVASDFYYNTPISHNLAIDMNELVESDNLANPQMFYDKNNLVNNFVVTEIDSDFLSTGLTINKSSIIR